MFLVLWLTVFLVKVFRLDHQAFNLSCNLASPEALTYMAGLHPRVPDAQLNDIPGS